MSKLKHASTSRLLRALLLPLMANFCFASVSFAEENAPPAKDDPRLTAKTVYQVLLGEIALRRGAGDVAFAAWQELAKNTDDPYALRRAIEIGVNGQRYDLALPLARRWQALEPNLPESNHTLNTLLTVNGKMEELATRLAQNLADNEASRPEIFLQLNRTFARPNQQVTSLALIQQLAAPYPNLPEAHYAVAVAFERAGKTDLAINSANRARELRPNWAQAWMLESQFMLGETPDAAIALMQEYVKRYADDKAAPEYITSRQHLARLMINHRQFFPAREIYRNLSREWPENAEFRYTLAILSLQLNDVATAEPELLTLLANPATDKSALHYFLGQIEEQRNNLTEAINHFQEVGRGEQWLPSRMHAARLLKATQRESEALQILESTLIKLPDSAELLYETALLSEKLGKLTQMETHLRHLLKLQPENPLALNALGYSLADHHQKLPEARQFVSRALALQPEDPFIMDSMGWVLFREGRLSDAQVLLAKAFSLKADPEIAAHLGEVLWQLKRHPEAQAIWQAAAEKAPDNVVLQKTIERFLPRGLPTR